MRRPAAWLSAAATIAAGFMLNRRKARSFCLAVAGVNCIAIPFGVTLGFFTIVLLVSLLLHQRQKDRAVEEADEISSSLFSQAQGSEAISDVYRTRKAERRTTTKPDTYGTLLVQASDDPDLVGHLFYLITERTTLGRSADNDIPFPNG